MKNDSVSGLDYYHARYYDPVFGRSLSVDIKLGSIQGVDPYAVITKQGIAALRRMWPIYTKGIAEYFAGWLMLEEAQLLEAAFGRLLQAAANK